MTISFVNAGTPVATADTASPFAATSYPLFAGLITNDLGIVGIGNKPFGTTPTPPGTFTEQATITNGTTANTNDGGSVRASAYTRTMVGGDTAPSFTWAAQYSPQIGAMIGLRKTNAGAWTVDNTTGTDSATGTTTFSAAGADILNYTTGDWAVVVVFVPTDAGAHTSPNLSIPSCTVANLTAQVNTSTTQGADGRCYIYTADITAGTASSQPTFTATGTSGATGSAQGSVIFLRIAEPASTSATVNAITVAAVGSIPTPIVSTPAAAAAFNVGQSMVGGLDQLGLGATGDQLVQPVRVLAVATIPKPTVSAQIVPVVQFLTPVSSGSRLA